MSETRAVLVVEDDFAIRRLVKMVLEREGYRVQEASDGAEAVHQLGVIDYDVIILDLMMPNIDGFAFMRSLSEGDPSRLRKIIITTAASPSLIADRIRGMTFDSLPKPFDIHDLVDRVRACITAQTE